MNTNTANIVQAARDALACSLSNEIPTIELLVTRDVRLFGVARTCFVGGWERGRIETYRHEQLRFDFAPVTVSERLEVAVIDECCGALRFELASEQHLWESHDSWAHDPVPTVVAEVDEDGELAGRGIYTVEGVL